MTQLENIEQLFFEARRSVFMVSVICFIGTGISIAALTALDPALGLLIPALVVVVLALFTLFFVLLAFRLFQPIGEIVKMVNTLYDDITRDELGVKPVKTKPPTKAEKQQMKELTEQVKDLTKKVAEFESTGQQDTFWRDLMLKYVIVEAGLCVVVFIATWPLDVIFAVIGAVGVTAIALIYAHIKGRLKFLKGDET